MSDEQKGNDVGCAMMIMAIFQLIVIAVLANGIARAEIRIDKLEARLDALTPAAASPGDSR